MNNSLQQIISTTILDDIETITITASDLDLNSINLSDNTMATSSYCDSISITGAAGQTVSIMPLTSAEITILSASDVITSSFIWPVEWRDKFPDIQRIHNMCEQYPGLKIAFEKFKHCYEMVKDDYDNPNPKK